MRVRGGEHAATCQHFYSGVSAVHIRLFLASRASTPRIPPIRHNDEEERKRKGNDAKSSGVSSSRRRQRWPVRPRDESEQGRARRSQIDPSPRTLDLVGACGGDGSPPRPSCPLRRGDEVKKVKRRREGMDEDNSLLHFLETPSKHYSKWVHFSCALRSCGFDGSSAI
jgi:hypothetical protein